MSKKCLVVDDVEVSRFVMNEYMTDLGFDVTEAHDLDEAIAVMREHPQNVVLLDWHLRQQESVGQIPALKKIPGTEITKFIVCSGVATGDVLKQVLDAGGHGYLAKPTTREHLQSELKRLNLA